MRRLTKLFEPIRVGCLELKNRIKMPAMVLASPDEPQERTIRRLECFYTERARGGVALMGVSCTPTRLVEDPMLALYDDRSIHGLRQLTDAIHAHDAAAYAQMGVGYSWAFDDGPVELVGPSGISVTGRAGTPFRLGGPLDPTLPRALSADEIRTMVEAYGDGARRAREAGFDAVEIIASVGYVISQFLSPLTNRRADRYGGSLENRMRLLLEIVQDMRSKAGEDFTYTCRLSGADLLEGGCNLEDTVRIAQALESAGIDQIDVMSGWHNAPVPIIQTEVPQGAWAAMAKRIRQAVCIPVAAGTQIQDVFVAERVLAEGKADMVYMARSLLADPELPNKAKEGRWEDITPCMNCCRCIEGSDRPPIHCSVNARLGRELEYPGDKRVMEGKRVLVVGGGPAGIEAATVAARRGHRVTLCERGERLGGSLLPASAVNRRIGKVARHLDRRVRKLPVELRLNTEVTSSLVEEIDPDVVLLAVGAATPVPEIPGGDGTHVFGIQDITKLLSSPVQNIAILGAGFIGCQLAVSFAALGKRVALIEEAGRICANVGPVHRWVWLRRLKEAGARLETGARVVKITGRGVKIDKAGETVLVEADAVVVTRRIRSNTRWSEELSSKGYQVHPVGDCKQPGRLMEAIASGFVAGQAI